MRRLALNDEATVESVLGVGISDGDPYALGARTTALVRLAALVAVEAAGRVLPVGGRHGARGRGRARTRSSTVLRVLAPIVGAARVNAAGPALGVALGYDMDGLPVNNGRSSPELIAAVRFGGVA